LEAKNTRALIFSGGIIEEAGIISYTGDLQEFNLKNLANDLLFSAYALEIDEIAKVAKKIFEKAN